MALPTRDVTGTLSLGGWGITNSRKPYLVFWVGDTECEWYFRGKLIYPSLLGTEVTARVSDVVGRVFLSWVEPLVPDHSDLEVEALEALYGQSPDA